jgi:lipoate-protein ligase A
MQVAEAYVHGFSETFGVELIEGQLSHDEQRTALALIDSTYGNPTWTHRR